MIKFIAMVETVDYLAHYREQYALTCRDSLTTSGRWTDARLFSDRYEAEKMARLVADGFNPRENPRPYVRAVTI